MDRRAYVEALRIERRAVEQGRGDKARLAAIDAELERYSETPARRIRETAVPKGAKSR